jgi:hypothetical protein
MFKYASDHFYWRDFLFVAWHGSLLFYFTQRRKVRKGRDCFTSFAMTDYKKKAMCYIAWVKKARLADGRA